ncbi:MAG: SGNH/GDSL hydrolase family protein [Rhodothermales bacterium]
MTQSALTPPTDGSLRYLALGDSYTIGEAVPPEMRWPVLLADSLRARGSAVGDPEIIAQTGWTTDELSAAIDKADPQGPYDLVTLLIGVNNQYRGGNLDVYRTEFRALLRRATVFAGGKAGHVIVVSIPDWSVTPFAADDVRSPQEIGERIDAFNEVAREETALTGAHFVDITPYSRTAATDPSLVAGDGLHPSGAMYIGWAERVLPVALDALADTAR